MDEVSLKWNNHYSSFLQSLCSVRDKQNYADVTLVCEGKFYNVHRIVLAACSDYFKDIFDTADSKNLVILMTDIDSEALEALFDYMYIGEVKVKQMELTSILKVANSLKIKGLAATITEPREKMNMPKNIPEAYSLDPLSPKMLVKRKSTINAGAQCPGMDHSQRITDCDDDKNITVKEETVSIQSLFSEEYNYLQRDINSKPAIESEGLNLEHYQSEQLHGDISTHQNTEDGSIKSVLCQSEQLQGDISIGPNTVDNTLNSVNSQFQQIQKDINKKHDIEDGFSNVVLSELKSYKSKVDENLPLKDEVSFLDSSQEDSTNKQSNADSEANTSDIKFDSGDDPNEKYEMDAIKISIIERLPSLTEGKVQSICSHLQSELNIKKILDLKHVKESHLTHLIKPIPARKLIRHWSTLTDESEATSYCESAFPSSISLSDMLNQLPNSTLSAINTSWALNYNLNYKYLSKDILTALENGVRPAPSDRRQMVRLLVDDIVTYNSKPRKRDLEIIAAKIINQYPESFADTMDGIKIGNGYDSFLNQLICRSENVARHGGHGTKRRSNVTELDISIEPTTKKVKSIAERRTASYGCVNYNPGIADGDIYAIKALQKRMKLLHSTGADFNEGHFKSIFPLQRKYITHDVKINKLIEDFPFLFSERGLILHFKLLTTIDLSKVFLINSKFEKVFSFMRDNGQQSDKGIFDILSEIQTYNSLHNNRTGIVGGSIFLLLKYFGESEEWIIMEKDKEFSTNDMPEIITGLNETPMLISCGNKLNAAKYMLVIDRILVNDNIQSLSSALSMLFASYFCMNIMYPFEISTTLEFIQRCFVGLNIATGHKTKKKEKSKRLYNTSAKVLSLIGKLADNECPSN